MMYTEVGFRLFLSAFTRNYFPMAGCVSYELNKIVIRTDSQLLNIIVLCTFNISIMRIFYVDITRGYTDVNFLQTFGIWYLLMMLWRMKNFILVLMVDWSSVWSRYYIFGI